MPGLREALEARFDELDAEAEPSEIAGAAEPSTEVETAPEAEAAPESDGAARDEQGRFTKPAQEKPVASPAGPASGQGAATGAVLPPPPPVAAPAFKAPQSWKPGIREKWATLPPEVQGEIVRREKEAAQLAQQRAEMEKGSQGWTETVRPYEAQIRASGVKPEQYVGDLLRTAHTLSYAPPQQKADALAEIIMRFGVPPGDLDNALVARMQGRGAQVQQQAQQFRDPRLDQFLSQMESVKQQQTQAQAAEASTIADSFAESHEFFDDVAPTLAHILDVWKAEGKQDATTADLERAYNMACQMNDDVRDTLEQRKAAAATTQVATQRARLASSSVRSQPTAGTTAQPAGRRAALEAAYDDLDR